MPSGELLNFMARIITSTGPLTFFSSRRWPSSSQSFWGALIEALDGFWVASIDEKIVGAIAIDGINHDSKGVHLRWFIVAPENQGQGIGEMLLKEAIEFCRKKKFPRVYLWTFAGLDPARHLYEKSGFRLREELEGNQWGRTVTEQKFELIL